MEAREISKDLLAIVKKWGIQQDIDTCLPTCLHNVLMEIAGRKNHYKPFTPSLKRICKICGHILGGTPWVEAHNGLRTEMRREKIVEWILENRDGLMLEPKQLCEIVQREDTSFPIVTLGGEHLNDEFGVKLEGSPFEWPSHSVIVIDCSDTLYTIFDTYNFSGESPVREIDRNTFESNWICGSPRKGMMWFEKKSLTLERFQKGDVDE